MYLAAISRGRRHGGVRLGSVTYDPNDLGEVESKEKFIVGVNEFIETDEKIEIPVLTISPEVEIAQKKRLAALKQSRSQQDVDESLAEILATSENGNNLMPIFVKAAHNKVTLGEMVGELKKVFGTYEEVAVF